LSRILRDASPVKQQRCLARQARICLSLPIPIHLMHSHLSRIQSQQVCPSCRGILRRLKQEDRPVKLSRVALSLCANRLDELILDDHPHIEITQGIRGAATIRAKEPGSNDALICLEHPMNLLEESLMFTKADLQEVIG
jgi:hypothetical protein